MGYIRKKFNVLFNETGNIIVDCNRKELFQYPMCDAARRLIDIDVFIEKQKKFHTVQVYTDSFNKRAAGYLAENIRSACAKCQYNKINRKTR